MCDVKATECARWCVGQGADNHCNASDTPFWRAKKLAHKNAGATEVSQVVHVIMYTRTHNFNAVDTHCMHEVSWKKAIGWLFQPLN